MNVEELEIPGVYHLLPRRFGDSRGYFCETYNAARFREATGLEVNWIQDNESRSTHGVIRGLHFQHSDAWQAKLVRAVVGNVLDVIVDLRAGSPTIGKHVAVTLSADTGNQLYVPRGFAHGFAVLSETALFQYKVDNVYAPQAEVTLNFCDPALGIDWQIPTSHAIISDKDRDNALSLDEVIARYAYKQQ